jgi:acyl-CoA synthetase (AMP-forming)/AMP-acid ligase II
LAAYKIPRQFLFEEIPRTSTGKIQKNKLREQINYETLTTGTAIASSLGSH